MNIADIQGRGKALYEAIPAHVITVSILVLSTTAAFGLGILAGRDMEQKGANRLWIEDRSGLEAKGPAAAVGLIPESVSEPTGVPGKGFVASKTGTKYYLPTCSGVGRIKEENRVWYSTKEEAEAAGLTTAANCPGI